MWTESEKQLFRNLKNLTLKSLVRKFTPKIWSKPLFRWFVYEIPLLVWWLWFMDGGLRWSWDESLFVPMWILIFALPAIWVWRKPLMRLGSFLNRVADDDSK